MGANGESTGGGGTGVPQGGHGKKAGGGKMNLPSMFMSKLYTRYDDDFVDQINHYYTALMLMCFAVLVTTKQYVGDAIQCWVPATFTDAMEQYTENYCWVKNTYKLSFSDHIPQSYYMRHEKEIGYYQWVPFILSVQAMMFYFPCLFWRGLLYAQSHINLTGVIQLAKDRSLMDPNGRQSLLSTIGRYIDERLNAGVFASCSLFAHCRLTLTYLGAKLMYAINAIVQFTILSRFLGARGILFGYYVIKDLITEEEWRDIGMFPRVTLCDFRVRVLGNVHRHTVQCVLMINMFNEKIFLFLWYWFLIVAVLTSCNFVYWACVMFWPRSAYRFVRRYLNLNFEFGGGGTSEQRASSSFYRNGKSSGGVSSPKQALRDRSELGNFSGAGDRGSSALVHKFTDLYLHTDGVFMLRLLSAHAGELATAEVVGEMWQCFTGDVAARAGTTMGYDQDLELIS